MAIFLTGATGYIGSYLAAGLLQRYGESLHLLVRAENQEEAQRRQLARDVFPHVQRFYDGWLDEQAREPFYRPSARHYPGRT